MCFKQFLGRNDASKYTKANEYRAYLADAILVILFSIYMCTTD